MIKQFSEFLNESLNNNLYMIMRMTKIGGGIVAFIGNENEIASFIQSSFVEIRDEFNEGVYSIGVDLIENGIENYTKEHLNSIQRGRGHSSCVIINSDNIDDDLSFEVLKLSSIKVNISNI